MTPVANGAPRPRYQFRLGGSRGSAVETVPPRRGSGFAPGCAVRASAGASRVSETRSGPGTRWAQVGLAMRPFTSLHAHPNRARSDRNAPEAATNVDRRDDLLGLRIDPRHGSVTTISDPHGTRADSHVDRTVADGDGLGPDARAVFRRCRQAGDRVCSESAHPYRPVTGVETPRVFGDGERLHVMRLWADARDSVVGVRDPDGA